ncbi:MAG: hypothetical protein WAN03_13980 [Candidatus Sulfotelmatobacter sp.]
MPATQPQNESSEEPRRRNVYASETVGLVVIALILLILTLVRYWHNVHWSWR